MGELSDYANEGRDYIILNDGESFTGTYTKYSTGIYDRGSGKGKKYISYHFNINGQEKTFSSASKRLSGKMSNIPYGTELKFMKFGKGTETIYEVEAIKKPDMDYLQEINEKNAQKVQEQKDTQEVTDSWDEA